MADSRRREDGILDNENIRTAAVEEDEEEEDAPALWAAVDRAEVR